MVGARRSVIRRWPAVAAAAVAAVLAMAVPALAQGMGHDHGHDGAAGILPPGDWTDEQIAEATALVRRAEVDLRAFADYSTLTAKGYHHFGIDDGTWVHWINNSYLDDEHILDPAFPEALVFRKSGGVHTLEAAMFYLPKGHTLDTIPADIAWLPGWHVHPELCVTDDLRFAGFSSNGRCTTGHPATDRPMTHVWIADNPCGHRFAELGVGIRCEGHHHGPPTGPPGTWLPPGGTWPPGTVPTPMPVPPGEAILPPSPRPSPVTATPRYTG